MSVPVIVGGGLAGFSLALSLAPNPVIVLARKMASGKTSSELAQGGIASAVGHDDAALFHAEDTIAAGAGLCDPSMVCLIASEGPKAIDRLAQWGVAFDRDATGDLRLGLEGAHGHRRIVHANGDATGASIMKALVARVKATPSITVIEDSELLDILTDDRGICGVVFVQHTDNKTYRLATRQLVLATGSACALWRHATVPAASWGHGMLLAGRAGARLRDLEFVQFHPTALDNGLDPLPLISEALRGEGAKLVNEAGDRFVDELHPRDVVARAIWAQLEQDRKVFLDARGVTGFRDHFPTILESCLNSGLNPREHLIPIRPVAHYHMGGIATDAFGATNIDGLYACGEVASTGLHGANRLASNSLLEAVVMGCRIAQQLMPSAKPQTALALQPQTAERQGVAKEAVEDIARVRALMTAHVGLRRHQSGLEQAIEALDALKEHSPHAQVGLMVATAALNRCESRGAHDRQDYPATDSQQAKPSFVTLYNGRVRIEQ